MEKRLFTSESVTEGHPDKICDQISDAVLDALMEQDPMSRVACETAITTGLVLVMGEITTKGYVDIQKIVRDTVREIGYDRGKYGFDSENCGSDFHAAKPMSKRGWDCMHSSSNLLAGYPHIYYYGNPQIPRAFLMKCLEYHNSKE